MCKLRSAEPVGKHKEGETYQGCTDFTWMFTHDSYEYTACCDGLVDGECLTCESTHEHSPYCSEDQPRIHYEEARKIRIMSAVAGQPQIREDAEKILGRILSYDKGGGSMELMKTLSAYFRSGGNTSRTARELIIHRQSLLKRLEKIEDLTGLSLKHEDDRFVLEVYSRLYLNY